MEGVWIVLGGALALVSGLAVSLLNARISRDVQDRQHRYDLDRQQRDHEHAARMEAQQRQAERQARRDEALRKHLRDEAEPLYEFLNIVERQQGRRLLRGMLQEGGAQERFEEYLQGLDPSLKERINPVVWTNLSALWEEMVQMDTQPTVRWQEVVKEYGLRLAMVGDEELRRMLTDLLAHVAGGDKGHLSESEVSTLIRDARIQLATAIIELSSDGGEGKGEAP